MPDTAFARTFGDRPFLLDPQDSRLNLNDWLKCNLPLDDLREFSGRTHPGRTSNLTFPQGWHQIPPVKIGSWYYPTGASRFSIFRGLMSQESVEWLLENLGNDAGTFHIEDSEHGFITTPMHMLPPRNLAEVGINDLYLVTLVDERYWWQSRPTGNISLSTWSALYSDLQTALGVTIAVDSIDAAYGSPSEDSDLYECGKYGNAALLLDAVAFNCGHTIVRSMDNTYSASGFTSSLTVFDLNSAAHSPPRSGGSLLGSEERQGLILPETIGVTFPKFRTDNQTYTNPRPNHLRSALTSGDRFKVDVTVLSVFGVAGVPDTRKVFHDDARATYATSVVSGTPTNNTDLESLAEQIALDYCRRIAGGGADRLYNGIVPWGPEGLSDCIIWSWTGQQAYTRVQHAPWNSDVECFHHQVGSSSSSSSSSSASPSKARFIHFTLTGTITSSASTSATVSNYFGDGDDPGSPVTVYNSTSQRFSGTSGATGDAVYDERHDKYWIIQLDC